ncbi:MAG: urease accessory protein UreD [Chthoniobacteraceae bacterium]
MNAAHTTGSGLSGHLRLKCALDSRGRSALVSQSFSAPFHLSKPHWDGNTLVLNVVNPTPGFFTGDHVSSQAEIASGASLLITTPSASRVHRSRGAAATVLQHFHVREGAHLEYLPEIFIPQAGARYRQYSRVELDAGSTLLFWEMIAPGRVASGEVFQFEELDWETEIAVHAKLAARERYRLTRDGAAVRALQAQFPSAYYLSLYVFSPALTPQSPCWSALNDLHETDAWIGTSALGHGGFVVKVVAAGSILLRRKASDIRTVLYAALGRPAPDLRRITPLH